ncbi:hypothetical protein Aduo_008504 [Ancylostoma duodenale]
MSRTLGAGKLNFIWLSPTKIEINFDPPEQIEREEISCKIAIYKERRDSEPKNKRFPSLEGKCVIMEELDHFERYFIRMEYETTGNDTLSGSTDLYYVRAAEGIPDKVKNLKLNKSQTPPHTNEYAVIPITWDEPAAPKGLITGYKIRWKLNKSPFNIFSVRQCGKSYAIKVFSPNERYTAFVSAKTIAGYGAENEVTFKVGAPPDWKYKDPSEDKPKGKPDSEGEEGGRKEDQRSIQVNGTIADRILFEAQSRRKIGHEYGIGHARVLISACTLMVAVMLTWFLKYAIFDGRITGDTKANKTKGDFCPFKDFQASASFR